VTRPPVEARRAASDDLDDLVLLWSQAREELGRGTRLTSLIPLDQVRARLMETLAGGDLVLVVGRYEGAAAGYAILRLAPGLLVDGDTLHVEHLFVLPSLRRRGVARAMLLVATSIAERSGVEQIMAGAPPAAKESHRFLARLGFSPLMVRRVAGTSALRRRLAGEGQRRGLDDLLSRRRSLRARSLRAGWGAGRTPEPDADDDDVPVAPADTAGDPGVEATDEVGGSAPPSDAVREPADLPARAVVVVSVAEEPVQHLDLDHLSESACPTAAATAVTAPAVTSTAAATAARTGRRSSAARPGGDGA